MHHDDGLVAARAGGSTTARDEALRPVLVSMAGHPRARAMYRRRYAMLDEIETRLSERVWGSGFGAGVKVDRKC